MDNKRFEILKMIFEAANQNGFFSLKLTSEERAENASDIIELANLFMKFVDKVKK